MNEEEFRAYIRDRIGDIDFKQRTMECFMEFVDEAGKVKIMEMGRSRFDRVCGI